MQKITLCWNINKSSMGVFLYSHCSLPYTMGETTRCVSSVVFIRAQMVSINWMFHDQNA